MQVAEKVKVNGFRVVVGIEGDKQVIPVEVLQIGGEIFRSLRVPKRLALAYLGLKRPRSRRSLMVESCFVLGRSHIVLFSETLKDVISFITSRTSTACFAHSTASMVSLGLKLEPSSISFHTPTKRIPWTSKNLLISSVHQAWALGAETAADYIGR